MKEELEKLLLERIEEAQKLATTYGVGAFLSGKASGQLHLAKEILELIRKENTPAQS